MRTPRILIVLLCLAAAVGGGAEGRQAFDLFLEHRGLARSEFDGLPQDRQQELVEQYLENLRPEERKDQDAVSLLKRLRNPDLMRSYMEGSRASQPYLDAPAPPPPEASTAPGGPGAEEARAAGLDVLEGLRPRSGRGGTPAPPETPSKRDSTAKRFPRGEPVSLAELASSLWGADLLSGLTRDAQASEIETLDGALLRVEYADLGPLKKRGDTRIVEEQGYYRVALDRRVRGTQAELALQAHELSHVRDQMERPEARPESFGLLMEHRANLYEVAVFLERHPRPGDVGAPSNFYDAELWFKARLYSGAFDRSILEQLPASGPLAQMHARAKRILAACRSKSCGGTQALYAWVVDPAYARSREGSILNLERESLEPELQLIWDSAEDYDAETAELDHRIREAYHLEGE